MFKNLTLISFLGLTAIILGAFGAHALKDILSPQELASFQTGVRYQMFHVILLLFINTYEGFSSSQKKKISNVFFLGIFLFSGSIYTIHLTPITAKSIWFITPLGGLSLVLGWCMMIYVFVKKQFHN